MIALYLTLLPGRLAVCRLGADSAIPAWAMGTTFWSVTRTVDELSVVCPEDSVPPGIRHEAGWRVLQVAGPLDFGLTGILQSIARPLAEAGVGIFAVSTFDTDHVLVKEQQLEAAMRALADAGHDVTR